MLKKEHLTKKNILIGLAVIFVIMQFFRIDKNNPSTDPEKDFIEVMNPPAKIAKMLEVSCYDCHSNDTKYPWYTNVAPVSWWVKGHINNGRKHLNFSEWADFPAKKKAHKLEECVEYVEETRMPIFSYTIPHRDAALCKDERAELVAWFKQMHKVSK